ncbi:MAG: DUF445 family protein [Bacteroidetes bacterium]|nr:MAG: DUF445 family protein [Bacteroidota bacterium]
MGIGEILSKILAGGFVGYITNDIAIKMLFEEYFKTRIGDKTYSLGGLIIKKRLEFQASISDLVERKVIHDKAIADEINKPPFSEALETLLTSLLQRTLPESFDEKQTWGDIPAVEALVAQARISLETNFQPLQKQVLPAILAQLRPSGLLTAEQMKPVAEKLLTALTDVLQKDFPTDILTKILQNLAQKPLGELVPPALQRELFSLIERLTPNIPQWLQHQLSTEIDELLQKGWEILKVEDFLENLVTHFAEQPLANLLQAQDREKFLENLVGKIQTIFQTDVREDVVEVLLKYLFQVLQEDQTPLYNLLSPAMYEALVKFLAEKLPPLLKGLQVWIADKKGELDATIQTAFQDNAGTVVQLLAALFVGNVGKAVGVDEKIIQRIDSLDVNELAQELTERLEAFLKSNTVGELLKKIPQAKIIESLSPLISENLQRAIPNLKLDNFAQWLERPINQFFPPKEISQMLLSRLRGVLMKRVQTDFLYTEKLSDFLQKQFREGLEKLLQNPLATEGGNRLLGMDLAEVVGKLQDFALHYLETKKENFAEKLSLVLHEYLQKIGALQLSEAQQQRVGERLVEVLLNFLQREYDKLKNEPIRASLRTWLGEKGWEQALATRLKNYLIANLPDLTKGRVKALVASSLSKQDDNKLRDMVYKAMGEELAPLNWFGAGLGIITGALLIAMPTITNFWLMLAVVAVAYGITGWGTNWVAVKMLFQPHNAIKIPFLRRNLPFTPGVIAKNKFRFANSMGRFIGDRLLDKELLRQNFSENRENLQEAVTELIQKNDYSILGDTLQKNQNTWAQSISTLILSNLQENAPKIGKLLAELICQTTPTQLVSKEIPKWKTQLEDFFGQDTFLHWLTDNLLQQLDKQIAQKETLADLLPAKWVDDLPAFVLTILHRIVNDLPTYLQKTDWLRVFALPKLVPQVEEWLQRNLDEILTNDQEDNLKEKVYEFLKKQLQSDNVKGQIFKFLDERLKSEFSANRNINQVMGGRIMDLIQNNLNEWLTQGVDSVLDWLKENRDQVVDDIYNNVAEQYAGTWLVKPSIIKTSQALIDDGIPSFFERELHSLKLAVEEQMHKLGSTPFNLLTTQLLHAENLQERVQAMSENTALFRKVQQLANLLLEERLFKIPLGQLLPVEPAVILAHFETLLLPETVLLTEHLLQRLEAREELEQWLQSIAPVASELLKKIFLSVKPQMISKALQEDNTFIFNLLKETLTQTPLFLHLSTILEKHIFPRPLEDWFEEEILSENISKMLVELLGNPNLQMLLKFQLGAMLEKMLGGASGQVSSETKAFLLEKLGDALFDALEQNIDVLLQSIDFKDIVVREIDKMHPSELEGLFYGFAGPYFRFIIGYGFIFGIIFGFLVDFGVFGLLAWLSKILGLI